MLASFRRRLRRRRAAQRLAALLHAPSSLTRAQRSLAHAAFLTLRQHKLLRLQVITVLNLGAGVRFPSNWLCLLQQFCGSVRTDGAPSGLLGGSDGEEEGRGEARLLLQKHPEVQFPLAAGQPAATRGRRAERPAQHVHDGGDQGEEQEG